MKQVKKHKIGDKRTVKSFAILPKKIQGKWIWFVNYYKIQQYKPFVYIQEYTVSSGLIEDTLTSTGLLNERRVSSLETAEYWETIEQKLKTNNHR